MSSIYADIGMGRFTYDVITLKGASYRLRGRGIDSLPSTRTTTDETAN